MKTDRENIKEELKKLAPELAELVDKSPFSLPAGYFEDKAEELSKNAIAQTDIDAAGKDQHYQLPKDYFEKLPHQVLDRLEFEKDYLEARSADLPKNYFEKLPGKVMARIKNEEATQNRNIDNVRWLTWPRAVAIAAAFAGVVIALSFLLQLNTTAEPVQFSDLDKVPTGELEQYVENNIETYGAENLESIVKDDGQSIYDTDFSEEEIETEELEEYLKEDIDLTTIEDLL